ncbi:MAG TPA: efflux RND transporter periplasmic adaptor subunit [Gemmatimonadales bacterium]|nr:efflux RND transporter periplasmic adaptor subunit [Gemmatimonadales bacterium]
MKSARRSIALAAIAMFAIGCKEEAAAPVYQAVAVTTRDISVSAQAAGAILPDTVVEVKSKASGEIIDFPVETGQVVQRGQLLARIDRRVPLNRYNQAEAQLEVAEARQRNAEAQNRRAQELFKAQAITEQEMESSTLEVANAKAAVISARTELENAKISLDDTEVRAPITGTVIAKNVERGAVITAPGGDVGGGTTLLKMADLALVQVKTFVDETDIGKLKAGMPADVTVEAFANRPFRGEVLKIEPQADTIQNVTMFPVLVRINNRDGLLRPGMTAEVNIAVGNATQVLAVPNAALRTERDAPSAASVLGISEGDLQQMLQVSREAQSASPPAGDTGAQQSLAADSQRTATPGGADRERMQAIFAKMRSGGTLTAEEQALMQQARAAMGNGNGMRRQGGGNGMSGGQDAMFGGRYIVFALREGKPTAVYVTTGITDLDWSEVKSGLTEQDSVLLLPSASLIQSQQSLQERMSRNSGLPGQGTNR